MITVSETFTGPRDFPLSGKYFKLLSTVNPVDLFFFGEGGQSVSDQATAVTRGFFCRLGFERIRIVTGGNETVKFVVSSADAGIETVEAIVSKASVIDTVADVALAAGVATQILPAQAARRRAHISNLSANVDLIRLGDASVAAARGVEIAPGQTLTVEGTEAVFGFSPALQSVGVATEAD